MSLLPFTSMVACGFSGACPGLWWWMYTSGSDVNWPDQREVGSCWRVLTFEAFMWVAARRFWKIKLAAAGKPLLRGSQGTASPALSAPPRWDGKKLCFWARQLLLSKQAGAAKSVWENNFCCSGFPHLPRSLGWARGSGGWCSLQTEPSLAFCTIARKRPLFKGELSYRCWHRCLLREKVWGVSYSCFTFDLRQINLASKAPSWLARPILKAPSPAGTSNNLLIPDVLRCPWGF